jgi:transcriptional regulator with XRE-family HTH domain
MDPLAGRRRSVPDADAAGRELARRVGREIRAARLAAGLSQDQVARAAKVSQPRISNLEHGAGRGGSIAELSVVARIVGLKLTIACFPVGDALRDNAQKRLIEAFCRIAHPSVRWRIEVGMPIHGDLRAVDALLEVAGTRIAVEAWTRLDDLQAQVRAAQLKRRDIRAQRLIMLVADTHHNRAAVRAAVESFRANFPLGTRAVTAALRAGRDPGADGIVLLRIPRDVSR